MKHIFTIAFLLLLGISAKAQLSQGKSMIGGTISFLKDKSTGAEENKITNVNINPSIGKFYKNNRAVGINLYHTYSRNVSNSTKFNSTGAGIFLRQYLPLTKSFYLYAEEGFKVLASKNTNDYPFSPLSVEKAISGALYFYPGIMYQLNKRIQLELSIPTLLSLSYTSRKHTVSEVTGDRTTKTKSLALSTGSGQTSLGNLGFGLRFLLGK